MTPTINSRPKGTFTMPSPILTNPYEHLDENAYAKFNAQVSAEDYRVFKTFFPRRGVAQSFINSILHDLISNVKRNTTDFIPADPGNEQHLVDLISRIRTLIWIRGNGVRPTVAGRTTNSYVRDTSTQIEQGTPPIICVEPKGVTNSTTNISGQGKRRVRQPKRQAKDQTDS